VPIEYSTAINKNETITGRNIFWHTSCFMNHKVAEKIRGGRGMMGTTQDNNNMGRVDIVIKVDELLDEQNRYRVEYYLLKAAGINRVQFDKFRQHILIVGYDPAQINSSTILEHIKRQRLNAQLIVGI
jgi:hypothetical protein